MTSPTISQLPQRDQNPPSTPDERLAALHEFEATKCGVKGLVAGGCATLPSIFVFPAPFPLNHPPKPHLSIPTVDLSLPRALALPTLISAAQKWGFFRLTNHSIPLHLLTGAISAVRSFHSLPASARSSYYTRSETADIKYSSNFDLFRSAAASWRDTLSIPNIAGVAERVPAVCREELVQWDAAALPVARKVLGMLAEGMGIAEEKLETLGVLEGRSMVCHCYPPCPEPEKTMGVVEHRDASFLTFLLQDDVGGLQVKKEEENGECWFVDVDPIPGTILVNVGDLLQIISNNEFKSAAHRVVANSGKEDRISIAIFLNPVKSSDIYGPLPELVSPEKPAQFRGVTIPEFMTAFSSGELGRTSLTDYFRNTSPPP